jgi:hypothetical protein
MYVLQGGGVRMNRWRRFFYLFSLSRKTRKQLLIGILVPVILTACVCSSFIYAAIYPDPGPSTSEMSGLDSIFYIVSVFMSPLTALIITLVALKEPRHPPKAILYLISAFLILGTGIAFAAKMSVDPLLDKSTADIFTIICVAPVALIFSLPGIYSIAYTVPEIRAILQDNTSQRVLACILARKAISFSDLAKVAIIPRDEVDNLVDELLHSGQLIGTIDTELQWIYTAGYLAEKQRQLMEWVRVRGRIRLEELAHLLNVSLETTKEWIYQLVQRDQFDGYVNWQQNMVYDSIAGTIGINSLCPQCGGQLTPAQGQRIVCLSCGTETWSSTSKLVLVERTSPIT